MTVLLDTSDDLDTCRREFGEGVPVGQLLTPLTRYRNRAVGEGKPFAIDNGAYAGLDVRLWRALLKRQLPNRDKCLFATAPDVVCSARRTLELFRHFGPEMRRDGWRVALVMQNGQENLDIPWHEIKAVFIGGDDAFKDGPVAEQCVRAAIALGKHVHWGRVNGASRVRRIIDTFGKASRRFTFDGSGVSQYTHMRVALGKAIRGESFEEPSLFKPEAA